MNHSVTFVDPTTGTHTQHVESYWNRVKVRYFYILILQLSVVKNTQIKLKRMRGCHAEHLTAYLDEFMWRERFGKLQI